jgi:hypothetical protein
MLVNSKKSGFLHSGARARSGRRECRIPPQSSFREPRGRGNCNPPAVSGSARTAGTLSGSCRAPGCKPSSYSPNFRRHLAGTRLDTVRIVARSHWRTTDRARTFQSAGPLRKRSARSSNRAMPFASITLAALKYLADVAVPSRERRQQYPVRFRSWGVDRHGVPTSSSAPSLWEFPTATCAISRRSQLVRLMRQRRGFTLRIV